MHPDNNLYCCAYQCCLAGYRIGKIIGQCAVGGKWSKRAAVQFIIYPDRIICFQLPCLKKICPQCNSCRISCNINYLRGPRFLGVICTCNLKLVGVYACTCGSRYSCGNCPCSSACISCGSVCLWKFFVPYCRSSGDISIKTFSYTITGCVYIC